MPVVKAPSVSLPRKHFSPYDVSNYSPRLPKAPLVRIHTPSFDGPSYIGYDFPSYDAYDDIHAYSLSQWGNTGGAFSDADAFESAQCPPLYNNSHYENNALYGSQEDSIDPNVFSWPYEATSGYDSSFSSIPESSPMLNTFSPSVSVVSCSPRSDALSLSPQPHYHEYSSAFAFDFGSVPNQFPSSSSSSSSWSHQLTVDNSPRSSLSHSPAPSCSSLSLDNPEVKPSLSRDPSPSSSSHHAEAASTDPQHQRRRFPCVIIGCERRFTSQYTLKVHMEAHKPKPRVSFPCTQGCSERFSRQHDRLRHEVAKHNKKCEFVCVDCHRFFSTKKTLGNHKCPVAQGGTRWVNN